MGRFWQGMFLAQLFVAWWVLRIGLKRLVMIAAIMTAVGSIPLWSLRDAALLPWLALAWGVANLSLLKATAVLRHHAGRGAGCAAGIRAAAGRDAGDGHQSGGEQLRGRAQRVRTVLICSTACHAGMMLLVLLARHLQRASATTPETGSFHAVNPPALR